MRPKLTRRCRQNGRQSGHGPSDAGTAPRAYRRTAPPHPPRRAPRGRPLPRLRCRVEQPDARVRNLSNSRDRTEEAGATVRGSGPKWAKRAGAGRPGLSPSQCRIQPSPLVRLPKNAVVSVGDESDCERNRNALERSGAGGQRSRSGGWSAPHHCWPPLSCPPRLAVARCDAAARGFGAPARSWLGGT
jgi:hypothetical protein